MTTASPVRGLNRGLLVSGVILSALCFGCVSPSAEVYGPDASEFLFGLSGSYSFTDRDFGETSSGDIDSQEQETLTGQTSLGYFLSRTHEIGALLFGSFTRIENAGDSRLLFVGPYYNYNIQLTETTSFYVGPQFGVTNFDAADDNATEFSYGGHIGLRHWLSPRVSLSLEPRYTFTEFDADLGGDTKTFDFLFGLNVVL